MLLSKWSTHSATLLAILDDVRCICRLVTSTKACSETASWSSISVSRFRRCLLPAVEAAVGAGLVFCGGSVFCVSGSSGSLKSNISIDGLLELDISGMMWTACDVSVDCIGGGRASPI
uniref:Putative secreted protein n=1 Tax=Anopheles darlingi TaxID=43151 RepID=A0A2M4DEV0_ANODA